MTTRRSSYRKSSNRKLLYHLLPVVFWLLAIGGTLVPVVLSLSTFDFHLSTNYYWGFLVVSIVLVCITILGRILRQTSTVEQCFQVAVLLGIASYWLPTVLFLILPMIGYLYYRHLFDRHSFLAMLVGFGMVAVWAAVLIFLGWIANPWAAFWAIENAWGWIPAGAVLLAWLASTIARQNLRER